MTVEEIKKAYSRESDGYIYCEDCPVNTVCNTPWDADGYDECYNIIQAHLDKMEDNVMPIDNSTTEDIVNHPNHYTNGGMECIDEMIMVFGKQTVMHFCLCNAWKYRYRAVFKNGEEDIKKSHWYMAKYKELRDGDYH